MLPLKHELTYFGCSKICFSVCISIGFELAATFPDLINNKNLLWESLALNVNNSVAIFFSSHLFLCREPPITRLLQTPLPYNNCKYAILA